MRHRCKIAVLPLVFSLLIFPAAANAVTRVWTDATGKYTLEAELVSYNDKVVVLQRADHELVAVRLDQLSPEDREFLKTEDAAKDSQQMMEGMQTWTLTDGTQLVGRVVDYARRDITVQRRRGQIMVNDRRLENLPKFYQDLLPKVVAHLESLPRPDRRGLESWLLQQRGQARTFRLEGVILEVENGDHYAIPFFMFVDQDQRLLKHGWDEWVAMADHHEAATDEQMNSQQDLAYMLQTFAAARNEDAKVQREIALMNLQLQAVQAGLTSLWEVTLYPSPGNIGPPMWVVVPGRDSRQATFNALQQNPGFFAGPVRRVSSRF